MEGGDDQLLDTTRCVEALDGDSAIGLLDHILETDAISEGKSVPDKDLAVEIAKRVQAYEDHLVFGNGTSATRSEALERVASTLVDDLNKLYATDLTRKSARLIARELCAQLWPSASLSRWRARHAAELEGLLSRLSGEWRFARAATEHLVSELSRTLGTELDPLTRLLVTAHVAGASAQTERRRSIGIVISHGYSTATSIADAANRILHARVFEAIDMPYDQQIKDVVGPLQQLVDRFSYCEEIAILVDMGSLEDIHEDLSSISSITLGIINNASTGLAVEVGAGMVAGRSLREVLAEAAGSCVCRYRVVERKARQDALVFCSEGGSAAAEKIRALVVQSLGSDASVRTIACGLRQLASNGEADAVFGAYNVRAIIGTTDPKIPGITFIALEDLISGEEAAHIDPVFSQFLDAGSLADFHRNLVKNMTLRNVVESITILNPNRLFGEIEQAVRTLERHTGDRVPDGATIGLYVHLCCLVERLVTRNAIETYTDEDAFLASHLDFVNAFRASFSDIATRYHVEVPVAEIAYVFDYINSWHAPRKRALPTAELEEETDE